MDIPALDPAERTTLAHRRWSLRMQQPLAATTVIDRIFFVVGTVSAVFLAVVGSILGVQRPWAVVLLIPVWAVLAYLALPRLHLMLSDFYVPDYFFGRTRTTDGLLGDPVNLAVDGDAEQLDAVMRRAGWHRADEITVASSWRIVVSTLLRRSYPTAPVSTLTLFGRRQDVAYQQEVENNPKQRHHVRFWHTPPDWLLPGGRHVDWLGAGTYDTNVGLSLFTLQVTHRIDENTDIERDHVVASVRDASPDVRVEDLPHFTTGYHSRNGGGDQFITDGNLPILHLEDVVPDADGLPAEVSVNLSPQEGPTRSREALRRAPISIILTAVLVLGTSAVSSLSVLLNPQAYLQPGDGADPISWVAATTILGVMFLIQAIVVWGVLRGGRRSRFLLMLLLSGSVFISAVDYATGSERLGFNGTLLGATLTCLALIALTSASSAAWVRKSADPGVFMSEGERAQLMDGGSDQ